ncbi:serine hydrolase [Pseudonocardia sp. CA-107938]|uniref:serine hydrolase n=1 Tax=Pseudonocardia sp. CA-107938 TaxID=3240021 RepID=UPI003D8D0DCC
MPARIAAAALVATLLGATVACSPAAPGPSAAGPPAEEAGGISQAQVDAGLTMIDGVVEAEMKATGVPGVAVGVVFADRTAFTKGYGVREISKAGAVDPGTVFQIASLSKPVGSTALAALVGKGKFAWDDPVHRFLPELAFSDPYVTEHVTFADLYAHRSGLPGLTGNRLEEIGFDRATILERIRYAPLDPFRATYSYSNYGMTAAGEAAGRAAGTTFEDVMQQELFGPAGMTSSSARSADFRARPDRATQHIRVNGAWQVGPGRDPDAQAPAGGISSTVEDLARWMRLNLRDGTLDGHPIVDADALAETHTPHILRMPASGTDSIGGFYGLGWNVEVDHFGFVRWAHSGAFSTGAATTAVLLPKAGFGVVVLTNGSPIGAAETIADIVVDDVVKGAPTRDWNKVWSERFGGLFVADPKLAAPPPNAVPARPATAYTGTCTNPYYGAFTVRADAEGLALIEGPAGHTYPLTHWSGDSFTMVESPELPDIRTQVTFTVGPDGRATSLDVGGQPGVNVLTCTAAA